MELSSKQNNALRIVPTGLEGLDVILGGGIPLGSLIMLVGAPGTGKTTLLQQLCFSWAEARRASQINSTSGKPTSTEIEATKTKGKDKGNKPLQLQPSKALYFSTLSEPHDKVIQHMRQFEFFDPTRLDNEVKLFSLTDLIGKQSAKEIASFIVSNARQQKAGLVTIDGLGALFASFESIQDTRYFLNQLSGQLNLLGITAILALEESFLNVVPNGILTGVDGIIGLYLRNQGAGEYHRVEVRKLRGMVRLEGLHSYVFNQSGLIFYPRLEALVKQEAAAEVAALLGEDATKEDALEVEVAEEEASPRLGFGLPELEKMLNGGLPAGSSTFVAGSPGVGKTLLSLHYLMEGVSRGEVGLYVGFYERPPQLVQKAAQFKLDLRGALRAGQLKLLTLPPVELEPDQVAYRLKELVEAYGVKRVAIDGVLELEIACREDARSRNYTGALDSYFKGRGITSLYTYTIGKLIGPELDLSDTVFTALAENLLLLRQLAYQSRLYRIVSVLKMRDSDYDQSIREFVIEREVGIRILEPFQSASGLLSGLAGSLTELSPSE